MPRIVAVHNHRGGVGSTSISAHLAALFARAGRRVGIADLCFGAPDLHALLQVSPSCTLNDVLRGRRSIAEVALDIGARLSEPLPPDDGVLLLLPASPAPQEIARVLRERLDLERLAAGLREAVAVHRLDLLVLDTPAGFGEAALLAATIADCLVLQHRPDTRRAAEIVRVIDLFERLEPPQLLIALNQVPSLYDHAALVEQFAGVCRRPIAATLPTCETMPPLGALAAPASTAAAAFAAGLQRLATLIELDVNRNQ